MTCLCGRQGGCESKGEGDRESKGELAHGPHHRVFEAREDVLVEGDVVHYVSQYRHVGSVPFQQPGGHRAKEEMWEKLCPAEVSARTAHPGTAAPPHSWP